MISIFERRYMLEALEELREPVTFFMKKFFTNTIEFDTKHVDVDVYKGQRRVAAYVNRREQGQKVDRAGFTTYTYQPPYIKPKMITTADDLLVRMPGEAVYANNRTPEQRAREQMMKDLIELDNMITRAEELQAVQALFDASIEIHDEEGEEVVADISFPRDAALTVDLTATGKTPWDNSGANILKDLRDWRKLCLQKSGTASNILVCGSDAADALIDDSGVRDVLDNRRMNYGQLVDEAQELGVTYLGYLEGFDIYQVDEWYVNSSGTEVALVPAKKVLCGSTMARCDRLYGAIDDVSNGLFAMMRYPKTWIEEDPSARILQLHSAPLMVPVQVDAFLTATVVS